MTARATKIKVYLEKGQKRIFASALDWPGWCRSGPDEESALRALLEYGGRYARVIGRSRLGFNAPTSESAFVVVERLKGNATTDFGAPGMAPSVDSEPVKADELHSFEKILNACCRAFVESADAAGGMSLRAGPRGGGRQLDGIIEHVLASNEGYLNSVGWKFQRDEPDDLEQQLEEMRGALLSALKASARGEIPTKGPRGGIRWTARYFVRRVTWHILDHAWEIEDRITSE
jgi:hypothetical protein